MGIWKSIAAAGLPLNLGVGAKIVLLIYFERHATRSLLEIPGRPSTQLFQPTPLSRRASKRSSWGRMVFEITQVIFFFGKKKSLAVVGPTATFSPIRRVMYFSTHKTPPPPFWGSSFDPFRFRPPHRKMRNKNRYLL